VDFAVRKKATPAFMRAGMGVAIFLAVDLKRKRKSGGTKQPNENESLGQKI
jgi:hypothetical protein